MNWIMRAPCRCVLGAATAAFNPVQAAEMLLGYDPLEPGTSMELVTDETFERDIRPIFLTHICGSQPWHADGKRECDRCGCTLTADDPGRFCDECFGGAS